MQKIVFEWNDRKNQTNIKKHGISFKEAQTVFFDDNAVQLWDEEHSYDEDRFFMLGISNRIRLLLVVHCFREDESVIRIISARKATRDEGMQYGGVLWEKSTICQKWKNARTPLPNN